MSDAVLDSGHYSPVADWYRTRPFQVAFALSVLCHAVLIAFIPGLRSVPLDTPLVLQVQIASPEAPQTPPSEEKSLFAPNAERLPKPLIRPPQPQAKPEPQIEPPLPRAEIIPEPRIEPVPELVAPRPEPVPEYRPEPRVEPRPEPPPVARVEPETQSVPREAPPPVVRPRVEPPVATAPLPPVTAPQPQPDEAHESQLKSIYVQSISKEIRRFQKYPPPAQKRGWEGTAEVLLQIAADGKVAGITLGKSSGHAILDEEAINMVRRAAPLPQAPADLRGRALVVSVPIVFRLQNS